MINIIIFSIFAGLALISFTGGLGMAIAGDKGYSTTKGFFIGMTIFGLIILLSKKSTDKQLVKDLYDRHLISKDDYEKTMEVAINNK